MKYLFRTLLLLAVALWSYNAGYLMPHVTNANTEACTASLTKGV